jgi:hypothetical protein
VYHGRRVLVTVTPRGEQHFGFLLDITVGSRTSFREYNAAARLVVPVQFVQSFLWDMSVDAGGILEEGKGSPATKARRRDGSVERGPCSAGGAGRQA